MAGKGRRPERGVDWSKYYNSPYWSRCIAGVKHEWESLDDGTEWCHVCNEQRTKEKTDANEAN